MRAQPRLRRAEMYILASTALPVNAEDSARNGLLANLTAASWQLWKLENMSKTTLKLT